MPAPIREAAFQAPKPAEHQPLYQALRAARRRCGGAGRHGGARRMRRPRDPQQLRPRYTTSPLQYGEDDARAYIEQARKTAKVQKNIGVFDQQ